MDAIKNYLENMFLNLPGTPDVRKAKEELGQMMEDRYHELIAEGKADHEAVGIVISEFGNLSELTEELGIDHVVTDQGVQSDRRFVSLDEVRRFLPEQMRSAQLRALGVLLIVACSVPVILTQMAAQKSVVLIGAALLLVMIAAGIGLILYAVFRMSEWNYLRKELCAIDFGTVEYVRNQYAGYRNVHTIQIILGVLLCVLCALPSILIALARSNGPVVTALGPALTLIIVAAGVFLFVLAGGQRSAYQMLIRLNRRQDASDEQEVLPDPDHEDVYYEKDAVRFIMSVYWPTITVVYLVLSFTTYRWGVTWLVWPIAGIVHAVIQKQAKIRQL